MNHRLKITTLSGTTFSIAGRIFMMANNEDEDILDSKNLGTVLTFPPAVQEAIDQVALKYLHQKCVFEI